MARPTASMEDYLEIIYELIQEKGYARVSDIAAALELQPSSVTRMVQRLDEQRYVVYERYRGLVLTEKGEQIGRQMRRRHRTLEQFLRRIGVTDEATVQQDVEGIEHHVSRTTLQALRRLVDFMDDHPHFVQALDAYVQTRDRQDDAGGGADVVGGGADAAGEGDGDAVDGEGGPGGERS